MSPFWKGFFSIFSFGAPMKDPYVKYKQKEFQWYHKGEWWEHPMWGDTWTKKKDRD
ncbi:MAG: hypothetical protein M0R77_13095 [Gammaproteobacteria bacterium]|nr:hypothetical protein [Gammaproteobacteria bacterium]